MCILTCPRFYLIAARVLSDMLYTKYMSISARQAAQYKQLGGMRGSNSTIGLEDEEDGVSEFTEFKSENKSEGKDDRSSDTKPTSGWGDSTIDESGTVSYFL